MGRAFFGPDQTGMSMSVSLFESSTEIEARELAEFQGQVAVLAGTRYEVDRVVARGGMSVVLLAFEIGRAHV